MIPKIIHYCWLSNNKIPKVMLQYMETWKILADYKFIRWDLSKFDINQSVWVKEAISKNRFSYACDYIRLYAVYNFGGIYLDMDMEVLKTFDDLLNRNYIFAYENVEKNGIEAGCFGAEKYNDFIKSCLDYYSERHFILSDGSFDKKTLPIIMKEILLRNNYHLDIFGNNYFTAKSFSTGLEFPDEKTYTIHHFTSTWHTKCWKVSKWIKRKALFKIKGGFIITRLLSAPFSFLDRVIENGLVDTLCYYCKNISNKK